MTARFVDGVVDRGARYTLGVDRATGRPYLSIPVGNRAVDYDEYYAIDDAEHDRFRADRAAAEIFADACRQREHDDRLLLAPGSDRGTPR